MNEPYIPLNRVVAFLGPYIAIISGLVADWLLVHVHLLATFHITHNSIAQAVTQVAVFGVTTAVVWLGHQKWLQGHIQFERQQFEKSLVNPVDHDEERNRPPSGPVPVDPPSSNPA